MDLTPDEKQRISLEEKARLSRSLPVKQILRRILPWVIGLSVLAIVVLPSGYNQYNPLVKVLWGFNRLIFYTLVNPIPEKARFLVFLVAVVILLIALSNYKNKLMRRIPKTWHNRVWFAGVILCLILFLQLVGEAKLHSVKPWFIEGRPVDSYVENGHYPLTRRFAYKSDCEKFLVSKQINGAECAFDEDSMNAEMDNSD